jgi:hypothetical protein
MNEIVASIRPVDVFPPFSRQVSSARLRRDPPPHAMRRSRHVSDNLRCSLADVLGFVFDEPLELLEVGIEQLPTLARIAGGEVDRRSDFIPQPAKLGELVLQPSHHVPCHDGPVSKLCSMHSGDFLGTSAGKACIVCDARTAARSFCAIESEP